MTLMHLHTPSTSLSCSKIFRNRKLKSRKLRSKMSTHMTICEKSDISNLYKSTFHNPHYNDIGTCLYPIADSCSTNIAG